MIQPSTPSFVRTYIHVTPSTTMVSVVVNISTSIPLSSEPIIVPPGSSRITAPELPSALIWAQYGVGSGLMVSVGVLVGTSVFVGVFVGFKVGVFVSVTVIVGVGVSVGVGVGVGAGSSGGQQALNTMPTRSSATNKTSNLE